MDYLYTLYDALVSISVPTDKARAVLAQQMRDGEAFTTDEEACRLTIDTSGSFPEDLPAALQDLPVPSLPVSAR